LKRAGIDIMEQLMRKKYKEVSALRTFSQKSLEEIINKLSMLGLHFKD